MYILVLNITKNLMGQIDLLHLVYMYVEMAPSFSVFFRLCLFQRLNQLDHLTLIWTFHTIDWSVLEF